MSWSSGVAPLPSGELIRDFERHERVVLVRRHAARGARDAGASAGARARDDLHRSVRRRAVEVAVSAQHEAAWYAVERGGQLHDRYVRARAVGAIEHDCLEAAGLELVAGAGECDVGLGELATVVELAIGLLIPGLDLKFRRQRGHPAIVCVTHSYVDPGRPVAPRSWSAATTPAERPPSA